MLLSDMTGAKWCGSSSASPSPGKCFAVAEIPFACRVSIQMVPRSDTLAGVEPNERDSMKCFVPSATMSRTGAKFIWIPISLRSAAHIADHLETASGPCSTRELAAGIELK